MRLHCAASRVWDHEAKQRPNSDVEAGLVLVPDPTQTALTDGRIRGWQVYANVVDTRYVTVSICRSVAMNIDSSPNAL